MEEDWIMRQIKQAVDGIGYLLKKQIETIELGEIQLESGEIISTDSLILQYIEQKKFHEAFLLVNSLKYKLSLYDFKTVSKWFVDLLKAINQQSPESLSKEKIAYYQELLSQLL